jgi:hypothetical protein
MRTEIIEKIKSLGLDDKNAEGLYQVITEEILDDLFEKLTEGLSEQELNSYETRIKDAKSDEHMQIIIEEMALTAYGDEAEKIIRDIYLDIIKSVEESIKKTNELIQKANSGDPEALELIDQAKQSQTYKNIMGENN